MEEITGIVKLISDCGTTILLAGILVYTVIREIKIRYKKKDNDLARENEVEKGRKDQLDRIHSMLDNVIEQKLAMTPESVAILSSDYYNKHLNELLEDMIDKLGCDRASIIVFHNGGHDIHGISFLKMSISNQRVSIGTAPTQMKVQAVFRSSFQMIIDGLTTDGYYNLDDIKSVESTEYGTYSILNSFDVVQYYAEGLRTTKGQLFGFLEVSYCRYVDELSGTNKQFISLLQSYASKIENIYNMRESDKHDGYVK